MSILLRGEFQLVDIYRSYCKSVKIFATFTVICLFSASCSINEYGIVDSKSYQGKGAYAHRLKAPGIHVDLDSEGFQLSIGFFDRVSVVSDRCTSIDGSIRDFSMKPEFLLERVYGLQLELGRDVMGVTIGAKERARIISLDESSSIHRELRINVEHLDQVSLSGGMQDSCV